ncbi:AbfB domain-containing protein [Aneurinibacillus migulanus]|uniref:Alpha-L-arabinofuranosidase B (ABFB) domain-containing protein n=2 Tax=Aneurinibacillus migulanus TaxID=47500 RepID=A0A0D1US30_ANEMI|nr:AbfB domain-containing protein [Aneurinibacillus migulanus]KIV49809.1 hypothetical protein TS65_31435 [Aneurinibacillus migulanus]KON95891.1 hypothetical protein AF333_10760 [Aneurinibacillus migulanus]MED0891991.1 AbfB domain-containing protein [Aneurinibacillus migulanus]MED1617269.1 AbfB domain-containing protein [Aneurinibacillus migulanus]SDI39843.1 Alpha-L-arabinofuranosidase B (ABFB) domain-containing protein [Aneurinibacillus migulanus]
MIISLESLNIPGHFISRYNGLFGAINPVPSLAHKRAATFIWTGDWYYGARGMLRDLYNPQWGFRHRNFRLEFTELPDHTTPMQPQLVADSTFELRRGQANWTNPQMVSFLSVNFPNRFIRHRDLQLWVEPAPWDQEPARSDATFIVRQPLAIPIVPPLT